MRRPGRLVVFEGPDGAGKSTLAATTARLLATAGHEVRMLSFPGREEGTLGNIVYQLHHDANSLGVRKITPASRQVLHVAAHIDVIEATILPSLAAGTTIVLDRFWWSTWVYGRESGVEPQVLEAMIECEKLVWGACNPDVAVLVTRRDSLRPTEGGKTWISRSSLYEELATKESGRFPVRRISNEGDLRSTEKLLLEALVNLQLVHSHAATTR